MLSPSMVRKGDENWPGSSGQEPRKHHAKSGPWLDAREVLGFLSGGQSCQKGRFLLRLSVIFLPLPSHLG